MADTLSRLVGPATVVSGTSTIFTGTAAHVYTIKTVLIENNTGGSITAKLGIGGVADANLILRSIAIGTSEEAVFNGLLVLAGTETIQANTSGSGLTITISGLDQS
jgi:hypothetical protein